MSLIKCPECGQQVSDKSATCIHCGYPLASLKTDGEAYINTANCGAISRIRIIDEEENELWTGRAGEVAIIHIEKPIAINVCWAMHKHFRVSEATTIKAGGRYAYNTGAWGESRLVEVDTINSGMV